MPGRTGLKAMNKRMISRLSDSGNTVRKNNQKDGELTDRFPYEVAHREVRQQDAEDNHRPQDKQHVFYL